MGARSTNCLECGAAVSLIDGVPVVANGIVGLRCRVCPDIPTPTPTTARDRVPNPPAARGSESKQVPHVVRPPTPARALAPGRARSLPRALTSDRLPRRRAGTVALVASLAAIAVAASGLFAEADPRPSAALIIDDGEASRARLAWVSYPAAEAPEVHALTYSLTDEQAELPWVHPIAGSERVLPAKDDRRFGAERPGNRPSECGSGHCGVDLGDERGIVIHAALGGRIIRVKRDASSRSGRYVAIEHPQGLRSSYMHLDRVHPDLVAGMEIASGEPIGLLGTSGIHNSPPHLHFSVERKSDGGWQYVDPEPMLTQAIVLDTPAPLPPPPSKLSLDLSALSDAPPPPPAANPRTKRAASEDSGE